MNASSLHFQQPLALAIAQIHRSTSLAELQKVFLHVTPKFIEADAYGLYLFDEKREIKTVCSHRANTVFLAEYEKIRRQDPLFNFLLHHKSFTHSLDIFNQDDWLDQPLHDFLSRWGLDYSIEAPLIYDGDVSGTLNFAIGGRKYFARESLSAARFLCSEFDASYKRILDIEKLSRAVRTLETAAEVVHSLPQRARQVLDLLLLGLNNRVIAERLYISENTVRHHIKYLYKTFDVHNRAQLVKCACNTANSLN